MGFQLILGHWLQIVVSRLRGPLADAMLRTYVKEARLFPPQTHLELALHLQPCPFAADCGFHVHVHQDLFNGLLCEVSQSKFYKHLETHPALRSYAYMHTLQAAPAGTFPLHCEYICS